MSVAVPCIHPLDWGRVRHRVRQLQLEEVQRGPGSVQLVVLPEWPGPVCVARVCVQCCGYVVIHVCVCVFCVC